MATSAAARVFAIPELLENILIDLANDAFSCVSYYSLEPTQTLTRVIPTSRAFKETIIGSPKLQSLIRTPVPGRFAKNDGLAPARWLLEKRLHLLLGLPDHLSDRFRLEGIETLTRCDERSTARFRDMSRTGEASWRSLELRIGHEKPMVVHVNRIMWEPHEEISAYGEKWELRAGVTLGEVFDRYKEVMQRPGSQHQQRYNRLIEEQEQYVLDGLQEVGQDFSEMEDEWLRETLEQEFRTKHGMAE